MTAGEEEVVETAVAWREPAPRQGLLHSCRFPRGAQVQGGHFLSHSEHLVFTSDCWCVKRCAHQVNHACGRGSADPQACDLQTTSHGRRREGCTGLRRVQGRPRPRVYPLGGPGATEQAKGCVCRAVGLGWASVSLPVEVEMREGWTGPDGYGARGGARRWGQRRALGVQWGEDGGLGCMVVSAGAVGNSGAGLPAGVPFLKVCGGGGPPVPAGQHCPSMTHFHTTEEVPQVAPGHASDPSELDPYSWQSFLRPWGYTKEK